MCALFGIHVTLQTPLPMEFSRQEYWSELPFPTPEDLPDSGIALKSPALAGGPFTAGPQGKPLFSVDVPQNNSFPSFYPSGLVGPTHLSVATPLLPLPALPLSFNHVINLHLCPKFHSVPFIYLIHCFSTMTAQKKDPR